MLSNIYLLTFSVKFLQKVINWLMYIKVIARQSIDNFGT